MPARPYGEGMNVTWQADICGNMHHADGTVGGVLTVPVTVTLPVSDPDEAESVIADTLVAGPYRLGEQVAEAARLARQDVWVQSVSRVEPLDIEVSTPFEALADAAEQTEQAILLSNRMLAAEPADLHPDYAGYFEELRAEAVICCDRLGARARRINEREDNPETLANLLDRLSSYQIDPDVMDRFRAALDTEDAYTEQ